MFPVQTDEIFDSYGIHSDSEVSSITSQFNTSSGDVVNLTGINGNGL